MPHHGGVIGERGAFKLAHGQDEQVVTVIRIAPYVDVAVEMERRSGFGVHPAAIAFVGWLCGGGDHNARTPASNEDIDWTTMMVVQAMYIDIVMMSFMVFPGIFFCVVSNIVLKITKVKQ